MPDTKWTMKNSSVGACSFMEKSSLFIIGAKSTFDGLRVRFQIKNKKCTVCFSKFNALLLLL